MNESFTAISLAFGSVSPILNALRASQHIIQAVPPAASPLLQLPHITSAIATAIEGNSRNHLTLQDFMAMPEYERRKLATDRPGTLTPKQYNDAMSVARQIPYVDVETAFFKVLGEKHITAGSLVQFVVKARVIPPGTANVPDINEADMEDIDPDEDDIDGLLGRAAPKNSRVKRPDGTYAAAATEQQPPLAYAPFFARDHAPRWHMFLAEGKQNRVAVPPTAFTTFGKPIFDEAGKPTFNVQTMKLTFQAPSSAGIYKFVMHLVCDSYIGMDCKWDCDLEVEDSKKAAEIASDDEISEPDEGMSFLPNSPGMEDNSSSLLDSLAGQMNALKTGGLSGAPTPRKKKVVADTSDDSDIDTDEEEASDTDTDTDTDGE
jgi:translocation protein SEC63